ncbi:hypothetical protein AALP_AA5G032200 [Arabis alpina]|uniref:F-box domain-containing protein n=1 Tax=Arabis alpina TaxID=50452 RepID=A0A087GUM7_ARAAL|nr:hypothetical protein AALP_AA5G032200 [Arabis alpina]
MASSSSPSSTSVVSPLPSNWSELPQELMSSILVRLGAVEILENAQKVCKAWQRVCKDPWMWRKIDMRILVPHASREMCHNLVDRSKGGLVEINIGDFGSDSLLTYIAYRSSNLRSLSLKLRFQMTKVGLKKAVAKLPLLEELEVSETWSRLDMKAIGHSCPKLKTLKLNCSNFFHSLVEGNDVDALAIAESMPELCHLQLIANTLTDTGLNAILEKCPHLEYLDLRCCRNIKLLGDL